MEFDRFSKPERIKPGGRERAHRLRSEPTWTEAKLWERLRLLPIRVRRQAPVGPYVVDFACLRAKLIIEVDGGIHSQTDVALRDLKRDEWLIGQGYRVLRIDSRRIPDDLDAVVAEITRAISQTSPLPLEGEGVGGWGEGSPSAGLAHEAGSILSRPIGPQPASTPPNPPPRGEGF
ncbi:MAG: endonuclease domain-containing protein [Brevundimonas sp.]